MAAAAHWLRRATPHHDRWFLFVDEFDPHEPFDTPAPWVGRYDDEPWEGELLIWPPYVVGAVADGPARPSARAAHLRANYGAKLSMIDHWFGRVLDALDEQATLGRHRGDRVHRPRPLPRREPGRRGHLGQAGRAAVRAARSHAAARRTGRASRAAARATR